MLSNTHSEEALNTNAVNEQNEWWSNSVFLSLPVSVIYPLHFTL